MSEIKITSKNWKKYAYAVGDYNPIHWITDSAKFLGINDVIAPGMYLASFIQRKGNFHSIKSIKMLDNVYNGETLNIESSNGDFNLRRQNKLICRVQTTQQNTIPSPQKLQKRQFRYTTRIEKQNINLYLESLEIKNSKELPSMFLASLSAPALIEMSETNNITGIHASQSFNQHQAYKTGPLEILIGDEKTLKIKDNEFHSYQLRWLQKGKTIASGKSLVLPLTR